MRLHDLKPAPGSHKERKRLGRGNASGQGTTAGKGTKGEKARAGGLRAGFRGMSSRNFRLAHRRGFTNQFKVTHQPVNVGDLAAFPAGSTIDSDTLLQAGLIETRNGKLAPVKILAEGDLNVALTVVGLKMSGAARQKIEQAGGSVIETAESAQEASGAPGSV